MMRDELNILIGGEAGQGLVTIGALLGKTLVKSGYEIHVTQSYMSRIRGGNNTYSIRVGVERPLAPKREIDILVALNKETIELYKNDLSPNALIIADEGINAWGRKILNVPFRKLGSKRVENTVALGVISALLGLKEDLIEKILKVAFEKKHPETLKENINALKASIAFELENRPSGFETISPPIKTEPRITMNGNEAIALGAMAAGIKFCSFYPMTPSTSIVLNLIAHADTMGLVIEQAEDEIAAINMALGASYGGAPSMVSTSGGGFALMTEGISLAGMTETPVVVVVAQRPGPATGLPTRTEQGDLGFVLHAGHGEFPRVIFAPGNVESCFHLAYKAFLLAEKYQIPVFILTDQYLADSYRSVLPFDLEGIDPVKTGAAEGSIKVPYKRYLITEEGISPRLIPGQSKHLVVVDSDEHTEDGHITEDLTVRKAMVEKRLRKMCGMFNEIIPPTLVGDASSDFLFVSWGSTQGAVTEAMEILKERGIAASNLHFEQLWPINPTHFTDIIKASKKVINVEGNATGQFARLIKQETGLEMSEYVLRYDGLPITSEYIIDKMKGVV